MGAKVATLSRDVNNWRLSRRRGTQRLGSTTSCPICSKRFDRSSTYNQLNHHIDNCLSSSGTKHQLSKLQVEEPINLEGLDFDQKRVAFRRSLEQLRVPWQDDRVVIIVNRDRLLESSLSLVLDLTSRDMRKEFQVLFDGEIAQDAGGLLKEWINLLAGQLFSREIQLFTFTDTENVSYRINPGYQEDQLPLYKLTGMVIGKALFENVPLKTPLSRVLFKQLASKELTLQDMNSVDYHLFCALKYMQDNNITGVFFETFTSKGNPCHDLIPDGGHTHVTEENKLEYIRLRAEWEFATGIEPALEAFKEGFYRAIPKQLVQGLESEELELSICGLSFIDTADWEEHTVYKGAFSKGHKVIRWFWEVVETMSQEQLSKLLQFSMGTTRLPIEGFSTLRTLRGESALFTVESIPYSKGSIFPRAHTCFNRLDLPLYPNKAEMYSRLSYTIDNHSSGFGLE